MSQCLCNYRLWYKDDLVGGCVFRHLQACHQTKATTTYVQSMVNKIPGEAAEEQPAISLPEIFCLIH